MEKTFSPMGEGVRSCLRRLQKRVSVFKKPEKVEKLKNTLEDNMQRIKKAQDK
jgi:hypothetical protein